MIPRSNHFCAHTAPADASWNCDNVTEWPKIRPVGYNHGSRVAIPWLWGSAWMLCNTAHVLCWYIAVNLQEECWTLLQSRLDCKNPDVKMINVRGWAAWPGLPTDSILLSGAVATVIKEAIIISQWLTGPSARLGNLYIAHRYEPSAIPVARFLSEMPLPDQKIWKMYWTQRGSTLCLASWTGVGRVCLPYGTCGVRSASVRPTWTLTEGRRRSDFSPSSVIFI